MSWDDRYLYLVSTEVIRITELPDMDGAEIIGASFVVRARDKIHARVAVIQMIGQSNDYLAPRTESVVVVTIE